MGYVLKRLLPGLILIALAMAVLLLSDLKHRIPRKVPIPNVALLQTASRPVMDDTIAGVIEGLARQGFMDGQTVRLQQFNPENDLPTANTMAKNILGGDFSMVITAGTPMLQTMASCNRQGRIVHVFCAVTDPFSAGVEIDQKDSLKRPRHLVGIGTFQPVREVIRLARKCRPELKKLGVVWCRSEACSEACVLLARDECSKLGITLLEANTENSAGVLEAAQSIVARDAEAIWIGGDNIVEMAPESVVKAATAGGIPVIANSPGLCKSGVFLALGADYKEVGKTAGNLAGQILKGLDPSTVKIENVVPQYLALNYLAMKGLRDRWTIPPEVEKAAALVMREQGANNPGQTDQRHPPSHSPTTSAPLARKWNVHFLNYSQSTFVEDCHHGFFDELQKLGIVRDRDCAVKVSNAQGDMAIMVGMVDAAITDHADLILVTSTPALQAVIKKVKDIPVLFSSVGNPVLAGAGTSYENDLPNVTGISTKSDFETMVTVVKECLPNARRVGTLFSPSEDNSVYYKNELAAALERHGMELETVSVSVSSEAPDAALSLTGQNIDAVCQIVDNVLDPGFSSVAQAAHKNRKPLFAFSSSQAIRAGAAVAVARDFEQAGRDLAGLISRVMHGEPPARIPFQMVSKTRIVINLANAEECGFTIPTTVLKRADLVVERNTPK